MSEPFDYSDPETVEGIAMSYLTSLESDDYSYLTNSLKALIGSEERFSARTKFVHEYASTLFDSDLSLRSAAWLTIFLEREIGFYEL